MNDVEVGREQYAVPKVGDNVRIVLIATSTERETRMSRGLDKDAYTGYAMSEMKVGESFRLNLGIDFLATSPIVRIGKGMFTTKNSTYSFEVIE